MARNLTILGSTGSIGTNTLSVVRQYPGRFNILALTANSNWELLLQQAREWGPKLVVVAPEHVHKLRNELRGTRTQVFAAPNGLSQAATLPEVDMVVSAIVGTAGLRPTLDAIRAGKNIGLANKETLVAAGPLVMKEAAAHDVLLLPVDSEHSAIFQCLEGRRRDEVGRIILTASGGPFRGYSRAELEGITPEQAVAHPRWNMGSKISVDSATLMNKGLEVLEAHWLFGISLDRIGVLVHPQSIVHSLVELVDGAVFAHMNLPDMRHPIQFALTYPDRWDARVLEPLELARIGRLTFERPDVDTFRCLKLALEAATVGETMPAVMNAANEEAVGAFLRGEATFLAIPDLVERAMQAHTPIRELTLEAILAVDQWARHYVQDVIRGGGQSK